MRQRVLPILLLFHPPFCFSFFKNEHLEVKGPTNFGTFCQHAISLGLAAYQSHLANSRLCSLFRSNRERAFHPRVAGRSRPLGTCCRQIRGPEPELAATLPEHVAAGRAWNTRRPNGLILWGRAG